MGCGSSAGEKVHLKDRAADKNNVSSMSVTAGSPAKETDADKKNASAIATENEPHIKDNNAAVPAPEAERTSIGSIEGPSVPKGTDPTEASGASAGSQQHGSVNPLGASQDAVVDGAAAGDVEKGIPPRVETSQDGIADAAAVGDVETGNPPRVGVTSSATAQLVQMVEEENWVAAESLLRAATATGGDNYNSIDADALTPGWGYTILRAAAEDGALEVSRLLLELRANVDTADSNGMTPLMSAVIGGDQVELVELLLAAKADVTAQTNDGFTALSWATRLRRESAALALRQAGAEGKDTPF